LGGHNHDAGVRPKKRIFPTGSSMRKAILTLKMWWLAPPDPNSVGAATSKKTLLRGLATYVALAMVILFLTWDAPAIYAVWLTFACGHGFYQYRYAFASTFSRPAQYEEVTALLLAIDIVNHAAVAGFSRIGWWALVPVGLAWLSLGRTVGTLGLVREMKQLFSQIREDSPDEPVQRQAAMTRQLLEERLEMLSD
jgi:hypothetical protein